MSRYPCARGDVFRISMSNTIITTAESGITIPGNHYVDLPAAKVEGRFAEFYYLLIKESM